MLMSVMICISSWLLQSLFIKLSKDLNAWTKNIGAMNRQAKTNIDWDEQHVEPMTAAVQKRRQNVLFISWFQVIYITDMLDQCPLFCCKPYWRCASRFRRQLNKNLLRKFRNRTENTHFGIVTKTDKLTVFYETDNETYDGRFPTQRLCTF